MLKRRRGLKTQYTNSKRILNILYKKLIEKKNALNHFELNVDRDSIDEGKAVKIVVRIKF